MKKFTGIILAFFVVAFTANPLMDELMDEQHQIAELLATDCCGCCAEDCCIDAQEGNNECGDQQCNTSCKCTMHQNLVTFTISLSSELHLFELILDEFDEISIPYRFTLPDSIWQPPKA